MDFDIPLPEELELLEANSHLLEEEDDYVDFHPLEPYPIDGHEDEDVDFDEPQIRKPESLPSVDDDFNGYKRPRSQTSDLPSDVSGISPSGEKRSKFDNRRDPDDEDWLRHSPARDNDQAMGEEEEGIPPETILSRYVSEIDGECVPITAPNGGERVYAKICRADGDERVKKLDMKGKSNGLISEPISLLLQKSEQDAFNRVLRSSSEDQNDAVPAETSVIHEKLWVDKYSPSSFTELLSDEQTNREVLLWLKQWDASVFGSEIRSTSDEVLSALKRHSTTSHHQRPYGSTSTMKNQRHRWSNGSSSFHKNPDNGNSNVKDMQDLWGKKSKLTGPPEQKILLLCGAPGLGKTTLGHVAAKHCGYRVVEINASDERSSSTVEAKILDVVQMNSVTTDSRPKCLVVDEIDGALGEGKGAIDVILKMVSAERIRAASRENIANGQLGKTSSKKERQTPSLSRPVICICNDLYAPALRPLRQVAKIHIFVQPTVSRVVNRLKYICNKEGMRTSSFALTALAEYTECDIRSCLNTLQFLNKKKQALNVVDIGSQVVGRKDVSKSLFDIWKELFHKRKMKREKHNDTTGSMSNRFDFLHSLISNRGDYDLIFDGIHENILQLHYHDPVMEKTARCLDCLGTSDMLHRFIMRTQQMPLYVYFPSLAVSVHSNVAQIQKPIIEWPKSYHRCRTLLTEKQESLRSWHHKIPPYIRRHLSIKSFVEDSVSLLLHILSPPTLRPVALHLLSDKEKDDLAELVSVMVSYSVTYKNVKPNPVSGNVREDASSDASILALDPPLFDLISFKGHHSSCHHVLALAMKQVLVHEVEKQRILQSSAGKSLILNNQETSKRNQDLNGKPDVASSEVQQNASTSEVPLVSSANAPTPKPNSKDVKKPSRTPVDFFERFRKSRKDSQDPVGQKAATAARDSRPLLFKFNEGFTNAVKRPVRMREFLL